MEQAGRLNSEEEHTQETQTQEGEGESRKSETELVIYGLAGEISEATLANILGGGQQVRDINMGVSKTFVAFHLKEDAATALLLASTSIRDAGGPHTKVGKARLRPELHSHEEDPEGPQPRYTPYPTFPSSQTGVWTDWGQDGGEAEMQDPETGVWRDWSKGEGQWSNQEWSWTCNTVNMSTGASSSRTSTEAESGHADPDAGRERKRPRPS